MEQKQFMIERAREFFRDRVDETIAVVQQDRDALRGWEEPSHLRASLRKRIRAETQEEEAAGAEVLLSTGWARRAGEPEPGAQREALGEMLEVGLSALEKIARAETVDFSPDEIGALACLLPLYARPSLSLIRGELGNPPPLWSAMLEAQREFIELNQRGVGRIELMGHPEYDWAGTGFLVGESQLLTTRQTAEVFAECGREGCWQFRPGISAWMDFGTEVRYPPSAACRIRGIIGVHDRYDLALFEVEPASGVNGEVPTPLVLAAEAPPQVEERPVYMIGFPAQNAHRNEPPLIARIFRDVYNVKRVQPGFLRGELTFKDIQLLRHDCGMLGQSRGSCIIDLETQQVLGVHMNGRYLEPGVAVPLWVLKDDPLFQDAGVTFAPSTTQEQVESVKGKLERLARSRYWPEVEAAIESLYQRAFDMGEPLPE